MMWRTFGAGAHKLNLLPLAPGIEGDDESWPGRSDYDLVEARRMTLTVWQPGNGGYAAMFLGRTKFLRTRSAAAAKKAGRAWAAGILRRALNRLEA